MAFVSERGCLILLLLNLFLDSRYVGGDGDGWPYYPYTVPTGAYPHHPSGAPPALGTSVLPDHHVGGMRRP